jgi:hypothetical protein
VKLLAYGEDALTLWAIQNELGEILSTLDDESGTDTCRAFYRPSFGRGGGRANFGEFDCILLSDHFVFLIESKWDRLTGRVSKKVFSLSEVQLRRHRLMTFYIEEWLSGDYPKWEEFQKLAPAKLKELGIEKPIAPIDSDLYKQLMQVLCVIQERFPKKRCIKNVLLFFHRGADVTTIPSRTDGDFVVVPLDCSKDLVGRFISL